MHKAVRLRKLQPFGFIDQHIPFNIAQLAQLMIGKIILRYHITERLRGRGMGVVYNAEDTSLGRFIALKFLPNSVAENARSHVH
jgi:serine/threonine protein kinase